MKARVWLTATSVVFLLLVVPPILAGIGTMAQHGDMVKFHLPQINYLIEHPFDLIHYEPSSATTPGHHIFIAWVSKLFGYDAVTEDDIPVRLINVFVGLALIGAAWTTFFRMSKDAFFSTACTLPLVGSNYVLTAAIWINTDNGAMLFYTLGLYALLFHTERVRWAALAALLMVMWRQIYLPVIGAFALPAFLPGPDRRRRVLLAVATIVPTVLAVAIYARAWGGMTPGTTQQYNKFTLNLSVPLHAVALVGLYTFAYSLLLWPTFKTLDKLGQRVVGGVAVGVGGLLWLLAASNYDNQAGRWGSLIWVLAKKSPAVQDKTFVVLVLAIVGCATIAAIGWRAFTERYYPPELLMLLGYFVGYSAQVFAWQRYIEPAILVMLGVHIARTTAVRSRLAMAGPVAMAVLFGLMSQLRIWGLVGRLFG